MGLRDVALTVIDAHMAIDVEEAERGADRRDAPFGEEATKERSAASGGQPGQLAAQRLDLWGAVEPEKAAEVHRRVLLEPLWPLDPQESQEQERDDRGA